MLKRGISLLLTMALLCGLLVSPAAAADTGGAIDRSQALDKLSAYDQVFTDMGSTSKDSMPIGNGSMASNVWVEEDGDLVLFAQDPLDSREPPKAVFLLGQRVV